MGRFYFHLRNEAEEVLDLEGVEIPLSQIAPFALTNARACIAWDLQAGYLDLRYRIDVHQANGRQIYSLKFADAISIA